MIPQDQTNVTAPNRSTSNSKSHSFANSTGAGSSSSASTTSPLGNRQSSQAVFTPGAASSSSRATAIGGSSTPPRTSAIATVPAQDWPQLQQLVTSVRAGGQQWSALRQPRKIQMGHLGADTLVGTSANDRLIGGGGDDALSGGHGDDHLVGGSGNDWLNGGRGNDALYGNDGDDVLQGGGGQDLLVGGRGADTFVLSKPTSDWSQVDVLVDFNPAQGDRIHLPEGITVRDLILTGVDTDGDRVADATFIQTATNGRRQMLALAGNTFVNGSTTITRLSFVESHFRTG